MSVYSRELFIRAELEVFYPADYVRFFDRLFDQDFDEGLGGKPQKIQCTVLAGFKEKTRENSLSTFFSSGATVPLRPLCAILEPHLRLRPFH